MIRKCLSAGDRFFSLVVTGESVPIPEKRHGKSDVFRTAVECVCDCGKVVFVTCKQLKAGGKKSCGCKVAAANSAAHIKHGACVNRSQSPEYVSWSSVITRCSSKSLENYGGRGISVCERWKEFTNFLEDMGKKPSPDHSIDRIDVNGDYCKENCRWATWKEQSRNKRVTVLIEFDSRVQCLSDWAKEFGMSPSCLAERLKSMDIKDALNTPVSVRSRRIIEWNGTRKNVSEWSREIGISQRGLSARLKKLPLEVAMTAANRKRK